jgi:agmatinase
MAPRYGPPDATLAPRYTGVRTFARFPHVTAPDGVDAAVVGVPFDTATSFRPGARFGPEAIRAASIGLRPYHPPLDVDVFGRLSVVDRGDVNVTPGNAERTAGQIADGLEPVVRAGAIPLTLGGDHSIVLGELRAQAAVHGPVGVVLLDAHADTWEQYYGERYFHGTPFKRALEEGLIDPAFAPATGTPEVCGLLPHEAIAFVRALRGVEFTGFDLVEVAPAYDTNAQTTALLAANIAYEFISLIAVRALT